MSQNRQPSSTGSRYAKITTASQLNLKTMAKDAPTSSGPRHAKSCGVCRWDFRGQTTAMAPRPSMVCPHNNENWSMSICKLRPLTLKTPGEQTKNGVQNIMIPKRHPGQNAFLEPAPNIPFCGTCHLPRTCLERKKQTDISQPQQSSETRTSPLSVSPSFALQPCSTGAEGSPSFGGVDTISAIHGFVIATEGRQFQVCHRQAFPK